MTLARVTIYGTYGGQGHINVLHFQRTDATSTLFNNLGGYVDNFWVDTHRSNVDGNMTWQKIHVVDVTNNYPAYDYSIARTGVLGPSSAYCPFICAVFNFLTATGGRHGRGRTFQGGYGHTSQFSNGQWLSGTQTRLDSVADALEVDWVTSRTNVGDWRLVIAPRSANTADDYLEVTTIVGRSRVGTMNSRKIGRGL